MLESSWEPGTPDSQASKAAEKPGMDSLEVLSANQLAAPLLPDVKLDQDTNTDSVTPLHAPGRPVGSLARRPGGTPGNPFFFTIMPGARVARVFSLALLILQVLGFPALSPPEPRAVVRFLIL